MNGKGQVSEEWQIIIMCEKMKWTLKEFNDNPIWFNQLLLLKIQLDAEESEKQAKKIKSKSYGRK